VEVISSSLIIPKADVVFSLENGENGKEASGINLGNRDITQR
jgi:hypothetical protein